MLRVIYKSAHFVNVNFFLLRGTHVIVTKKGLKIYLFNKKNKVVQRKALCRMDGLFFCLKYSIIFFYLCIDSVYSGFFVLLATVLLATLTIDK